MLSVLFALSMAVCLLWPYEAEGQTTGSLRLVVRGGRTSSSLTAGRLEVYYNRQWGTVCNDGFDNREARVACRQLGFSAGYLSYGTAGTGGSVLSFPPASTRTRIWLDDLSCSGDESRLDDCRIKSFGSHNCGHNEDVTLSCLGNGALRLSSSSSSGRLEVYYNGRWGTVCDDSFGRTDADVACRQLGFALASRYGTVRSLGYRQGSGTIWLDNLRCTSYDLMLSTCRHSGFGNEDCSHSEDVALSCATHIYPNADGTSRGLSRAAIGGIILGVTIPVGCCIGVCTVVLVIVLCTGDYTGRASDRSTSRSVAVRTKNKNTVGEPTVKFTAGTTAPTNAPPPYPGH